VLIDDGVVPEPVLSVLPAGTTPANSRIVSDTQECASQGFSISSFLTASPGFEGVLQDVVDVVIGFMGETKLST
jgi:hypothetical protein